MKKLSKVIISLGLFAILGFSLSACNTIEGIGQDARAAGDAISGAARDNRSY